MVRKRGVYMLGSLGDHILPPRCLMCGSLGDVRLGVCSMCSSLIRRVPEPVCDICGIPIGTSGICLACTQEMPPYDRMRGVFCFEGLLKDMIHAFKYGRYTALKRFLGKSMVDGLSCGEKRLDFLTYVPMHWTKVMERGYNQAALLAKEVSRHTGLELKTGVLKKVRNTQAQAGLDKQGRGRNVRGAFAASGVEGKSIMVVDDVITTGETAREVARTLKKAGAAYVFFASLGRVV